MRKVISGFIFHDLVNGTMIRNCEVEVTAKGKSIIGYGTVDLNLELQPFMYKDVIITIEGKD